MHPQLLINQILRKMLAYDLQFGIWKGLTQVTPVWMIEGHTQKSNADKQLWFYSTVL